MDRDCQDMWGTASFFFTTLKENKRWVKRHVCSHLCLGDHQWKNKENYNGHLQERNYSFFLIYNKRKLYTTLMLYWRKDFEAIIFVVVSKGNKGLFIIIRGLSNRRLWSWGEELLHNFKVFIFSFGTGQKRLGFGFLGKECFLGFGMFNGWCKKAFGTEPVTDHGVSQFRLFIKLWPPFYFEGSLNNKLGFLGMKSEIPHPYPW